MTYLTIKIVAGSLKFYFPWLILLLIPAQQTQFSFYLNQIGEMKLAMGESYDIDIVNYNRKKGIKEAKKTPFMLTQANQDQCIPLFLISRKLQTSNKKMNTKLVFFRRGLYLLEDSGADEDSNMASLVFLIGREGLHTQTKNVSDSYY